MNRKLQISITEAPCSPQGRQAKKPAKRYPSTLVYIRARRRGRGVRQSQLISAMKTRLSRNLAQKGAAGAHARPVRAGRRLNSFYTAHFSRGETGLRGARLPHRIHSACIIQWRTSSGTVSGRINTVYYRGGHRTSAHEKTRALLGRGHERLHVSSWRSGRIWASSGQTQPAISDGTHLREAG